MSLIRFFNAGSVILPATGQLDYRQSLVRPQGPREHGMGQKQKWGELF
ncbi:MAG TPA: hypothetical protein VE959_18810 [Bryobacteraceae bacterium]|nr:hypothetical protein [Bryobacteraceae bacterium]